jgi:hypothetical protein
MPIVGTGLIVFSDYASSETGVSAAAVSLRESFNRFVAHQENSESLFGAKAQLISELRELAAECAAEDWDGYGALPIKRSVLLRAEAFIRALPDSIPAPEISAEADGQISFDWLPSRTRTFTLSVNAGNRLAYAWIDGANRGNAAEVFDSGCLPSRLLRELKQITADATTIRFT